MRPRIHLITLGVRDFARSVEFYTRGLGWTASSASGDDVTFLQLGGLVLALFPRDKLAEDATIPAEGTGFAGFTLAHNVRSEAEVDEVLREAVAAGARLVKPGQKAFWGGYTGYFADPDGYLWEVAWNPFFPFDEHDQLVLPI